MKKALDRFSKQAATYKKFRPVYPPSLYDSVLEITRGREVCWDCGTGNGQVSAALAQHFEQVQATDISRSQIREATKRPNITYSVGRAEQTRFPADHFDLITVAQAIHWFDIPKFFAEAGRVGKAGGTLAVWGYGLLAISREIDSVIQSFYRDTLGPYWDPERLLVDRHYKTIECGFPEIKVAGQPMKMARFMDPATLKGYLNTWSAVQNYLRSGKDNPVDGLITELGRMAGKDTGFMVTFPVFIRAWRIQK